MIIMRAAICFIIISASNTKPVIICCIIYTTSIKCNIYDFEKKNKNLNFNTKVLWSKNVNDVYKKMFDINLIKNKLSKVDKLRFNLSYLLCLMRGVNANYEEKINFHNCKNNIFQNNGILFALLTVIYAQEVAKNK